MPRSKIDTLTEEDREHLARATLDVERASDLLDEATAIRHRLWLKLVERGATQSEVARASNVIRQAVGWAVAHPK